MKPKAEPASQDTQQSAGVSEEAKGHTGHVRVRFDESNSWKIHRVKAERSDGFLQLQQQNTEESDGFLEYLGHKRWRPANWSFICTED